MEKVIVTPGFEITPNIPIPSLREEESFRVRSLVSFQQRLTFDPTTVCPLSPNRNKEYTVN